MSRAWVSAAWADFSGRKPARTGLRNGVGVELILWSYGKVLTASFHRLGLWNEEEATHTVNLGEAMKFMTRSSGGSPRE